MLLLRHDAIMRLLGQPRDSFEERTDAVILGKTASVVATPIISVQVKALFPV
jgi:hypothetical protein